MTHLTGLNLRNPGCDAISIFSFSVVFVVFVCLFNWLLRVKTHLGPLGCTPPKTSRPALLCKLVVFSTQMLTKEVWLIKNRKIALACLFFVVDVLIWCLSQQISVKKAFCIKNWEIWELFILFLLQQSRTTEC